MPSPELLAKVRRLQQELVNAVVPEPLPRAANNCLRRTRRKKVDVVFGHVALDDADIVIVADRPQQVSSPNRRPSVSTLRRYSVTHITCRWIQKTSDSWADTVSHAELTIDHRTAQS